jgi:hypothetical protein
MGELYCAASAYLQSYDLNERFQFLQTVRSSLRITTSTDTPLPVTDFTRTSDTKPGNGERNCFFSRITPFVAQAPLAVRFASCTRRSSIAVLDVN